MSVEFFVVFLSDVPFVVVDLSLFLEVNLLVQGIIVELRVFNFVHALFVLVRQEKIVHNLNSVHNLLLLENILNDDQSDIVLELRNGFLEFVLRDAVAQEVGHEVLVVL